MAESVEDTVQEEETDFQKTLALIGGKERVYLVSDPRCSKDADENGNGILQEFIRDIFPGGSSNSTLQPRFSPPRGHGDAARTNRPSGNDISLTARPKNTDQSSPASEGMDGEKPSTCNGSVQRTALRRASAHSSKRTIDSPVIIFLFRETYLSKSSNHVCLKEILKDVKARTRRARIARPALIGLVSTKEESAETQRYAHLLERLLRCVFHKHSPEMVWVGRYIPNTEANMLSIKRNACKVIHSSQTADNTQNRGNPIFWPLRCFFWPRRRGPQGQANNSSSKERDNRGSKEESIPLKKSMSARPPVNEEISGGDS